MIRKLIVFLSLLAVSLEVYAVDPTFVAACSDFELDNNMAVETPTCTASGSNMYIFAFPVVGSGAPAQPTSVKWNSSAGTGGDSLAIDGTSSTVSFGNMSRWYKAGPAAATGTTYAAYAANQNEQIISGLIYSNVGSLRTAPTPTTGSFFASGTGTITATTVAGDMVVGCIVDLVGTAANPILTPDATQTARGTSYDNGTPSGNYAYGCSEKLATTTSTTLSWTLASGSGTHNWIVMAFVLIPPGAGGSSAVTVISSVNF